MENYDKVYDNAINEAKKLMYNQTIKNGAPSWLLTMLAVRVGGMNLWKIDMNFL